MAAYGVTFGEKHSIRDWGLLLAERPVISPPEPKTIYLDVAGSDGGIDATEVLGDVKYDWRSIQCTFSNLRSRKTWSSLYSSILDYLHGQQMKIILDEDPGYYYWGRVCVNEWKSEEKYSTIVIEGKVDPYKYECRSSLEDWTWDDFNFENGVIRDYSNLQVNGNLTVTIPGTRMVVVPVITASATMTVRFEGQSYTLVKGKNEIPEIQIVEGDNILTFSGSGTVSINYRGGSL